MWLKTRTVQTRKSTIQTILITAVFMILAGVTSVWAQSPAEQEGIENPLKWDEPELRFITDSDYPPFNYLDEDGALTGFNVDLARAICLEMEVRCDIQAKSWNDLIPSIKRGDADAIIASLAITKKNIEQVDFSDRYFRMHARFAMRSGTDLKQPVPEKLSRYTIGVLKGTAHEAYLKDFFIYSSIKSFDAAPDMYLALQEKKIDLVFGDGVTLMFWLNGQGSQGCCRFLGGTFTEARYFGEGVAIAVAKNNKKLRIILNKALEKVRESGRYEELILRYFPLRF